MRSTSHSLKVIIFLLNINLVPFLCWTQNFNRPVPPDIAPYEFIQNDSNFDESFFITPFQFSNAPSFLPSIQILDENGYLLWYLKMSAYLLIDFKYHETFNLYTFTRVQLDGSVNFFVMDSNFTIIDSFENNENLISNRHEFDFARNGNYLISAKKDSILDLSSFVFDGIQGGTTTKVRGFVIQELSVDHKLVFEWNSNDHIFPTEAFEEYGYSVDGFDYAHGNSIEEGLDGNLLVSFRHLNALYNIDRKTGEVLWQLGGKSSSFEMINDHGFSGQHDARILSNGNVTLFDNATMGPIPRKSRVVEYQLDTINWTATKVYEKIYPTSFFSEFMGSFQVLDSYCLIGSGSVSWPDPSLFLMNDQNQIMTELFYQKDIFSYRSFVYNLSNQVERPEISCQKINDQIYLSAPNGYEKYLWSTGEENPTIQVSAKGEYQFWVNYGDGMLGSKPFNIEEINDSCNSTAVSNPINEKELVPIQIYDITGRKIETLQPGNFYIYRYDGKKSEIVFYNGF